MNNALEVFEPTVKVLKDTSTVGITWVGRYALMVLGAGALFATTGAWAAAVVIGVPFLDALSVLALCVATLILSFILWSAGAVGDWLTSVIVEGVAQSKHARQKIVKIETTPTTETAYLPAKVVEPRVLMVTAGERVGEVTVDYVNGFNPKTLEFWAQYLANGNATSETRLEHMPLPHGERGQLFGGLTPGTPLTRLLDLTERRGISTARDGVKRKPGTLLIKDEAEILRLLLQEDKQGNDGQASSSEKWAG
jgi:hypothetical protein